MRQDLRIAAVVCHAPAGEIDANLARTEYWTRKARSDGAALVCFPELNITGYCNHPDIFGLAQPIPGPATRRISRLARETGMVVLAGMAENNPAGRPFATHCVFFPDGRMSVYRKLHLAHHELPYFDRGDEIPLFDAGGVKFGIQLCYDGHFPELSTAMAARGAHLLILPHASPRTDAPTKHQSWMRHLPARAYDNSVFLMACNQCGDNGKGLRFPGNALVIDPSGNILKKAVSGKEGLLVADLKAETFDHVRSHPMRYFFPNRRPELYDQSE